MGKFDSVLLGSDFDYTLTDFKGEVPKRNFDAISLFEQNGGMFCIATGRSYHMFKPKLDIIEFNAPTVLFNGGVIYYHDKREFEILSKLSDECYIKAEKIQKKHAEFMFEVQCIDCHYYMGENESRLEFLKGQGVKTMQFDINNLPKDGQNIVFFAPSWYIGHRKSEATEEEMAVFFEIEREFSNIATVLHSLPKTVEINPKNTDKGSALRLLARRAGRKILACVGDGENDITMLREADYSFAPLDCQQSVRDGGFTLVCAANDGAVADVIGALADILSQKA